MFKEMLRGITSFFTSDKILVLVVFLVLIMVLSMYSNSKSRRLDAMSSLTEPNSSYDSYQQPSSNYGEFSNNQNTQSFPSSVEDSTTMLSSVVPSFSTQEKNEEFSGSITNPMDLLPTDDKSEWASLNPVNSGNIAMPDLLQAGYNIGLDTIGQSLRNANLQLRSDPIIPKQEVGPWNLSTIEPDYGRVPLEIGPISR